MNSARFRFYAELNYFLPRELRQKDFRYTFEGKPAVKDAIEALGVPHTEVDLILANGVSEDFCYHLQDGDRISVYPVFESLDIIPVVRVRPQPLRETRFVLDTHLGRLAGYLRLLGFDAIYRNDFEDKELASISRRKKRVLLTRDRGLLKRSEVTHGYCVRETSSYRKQIVEVLRRFDLFGSIKPFQRCLRCNGLLERVSKEEISDRLQPKTKRYYNQFWQCQTCDQVYWKGSHYQRMKEFIDRISKENTLNVTYKSSSN